MTANEPRGLFGSAKNLVITGGTFTQIHQINSLQETGLIALSQQISPGAMYDSAERYTAGRCHPGTREEIISMILEWVNNPSPKTDILWLYGPAGAGKSSILQSIAELLYRSYRERYAGSFFFAKGVPGRGHGHGLFSTLAYQVACNVSGMRAEVDVAMQRDHLLPTKTMAVQLDTLIVSPLLSLSSPPSHTPTIIIDGLDECQGSDDQRTILSLITNRLSGSPRVPLRFLIASRPEHTIRTEFDRPVLVTITERVELSHSRQTSRDIRKYLEDGFDKIYEQNQDVMEGVVRPWPSIDRVNQFVRNASGQFIYASTVLKYIGSYSDFSDPQTQLDIICKPGLSRTSAFSSLDQLYMDILANYPRRDKLMKVLSGLFIKASVKTIECFLEVEPNEFRMVLRAISSLVKLPKARMHVDSKDLDVEFGALERPILFSHLSFRDFLQDRTRSGEFWINTKEIYSDLYNRLIDVLIRRLNQDRLLSLGIPIAYDDYWGMYSYSTILKSTSPAAVIPRLLDLRMALESFHKKPHDAISYAEHLLQAMQAAIEFLGSITKDFFRVEEKFTEAFYKELVLQVRRVRDTCFRQTISIKRFLQVDKAVIFILSGGSVTLQKLSKILQITEIKAAEFLKENRHLIKSGEASSYDQERSQETIIRDYAPMESVVSFLLDSRRSGIFHRVFRKQVVGTCRDLITQLVETQLVEEPESLSEDAHSFISEFLSKKALTRLQYKDDPEVMSPILKSICEIDWSVLGTAGGEDFFNTTINILQFLHQTLNDQRSSNLLKNTAPEVKSHILGAMKNIYEAIIMRPASTSYFIESQMPDDSDYLPFLEFPPPSDTTDGSASTTGIPPYSMNCADLDSIRDYEFSLSDKVPLIREMLDGATYQLEIDRSYISTCLLEFYLQFWATEFFVDSECAIGSILGNGCASLFKYANPSLRILVGLWTLRDLDSKKRLKPNLPSSFVLSAKDYIVQYHDLDLEKLETWLQELMARSITRKEVQSNSDIPSDLGSTDGDDESDLSDENHDDDHGYELGPEAEGEDEDFESIYV